MKCVDSVELKLSNNSIFYLGCFNKISGLIDFHRMRYEAAYELGPTDDPAS